jgi:hypothetical protein
VDTAYSMTQGKNIQASNPSLVHSLIYWNLGLRCPDCEEPVYWKSGGTTRSPHFSHFQKTSLSKDCSLRTNGETALSGGDSFTENSLLLKDIQNELVYFVAGPLALKLIPSLDENIQLSEREERVVNLFQGLDKLTVLKRFEEVYELCLSTPIQI